MSKCQCAVCKYSRKEIKTRQLLVRLRKQIMGYLRFLKSTPHIISGSLGNTTLEDYKACIECNIKEAYYLRHCALQEIKQQLLEE